MSKTLEELKLRENIHDYLERIGAKPPLIDIKVMNQANKHILWVNTIEEAVQAIVNMDEAVDIGQQKEKRV